MPKSKSIRTNIAWSEVDKITVKGYDICNDILGKLSLGDVAFLMLTDRLPNARESVMFKRATVSARRSTSIKSSRVTFLPASTARAMTPAPQPKSAPWPVHAGKTDNKSRVPGSGRFQLKMPG